MNKTSITLTAAALMACAGGAASAGTVAQTLIFGPAVTNWTHTFSFSGFNAALGTLTKVTDTITEDIVGSIDVTNTGSSSAAFSAQLTNVADKTFPGLTVTSTSASNTETGTLAPGASTGSLPLSGSSTGSGTTMSGLGVFEGATVSAIATDRGTLAVSSSTLDFDAVFTDTGMVKDVLVYTYASVTPVPEPGTLAVIGTALAGLGWARRRKCPR